MQIIKIDRFISKLSKITYNTFSYNEQQKTTHFPKIIHRLDYWKPNAIFTILVFYIFLEYWNLLMMNIGWCIGDVSHSKCMQDSTCS